MHENQFKAKKDPLDNKILDGTDETGEAVYKTYREKIEEIDMDDKYIQKAKECLL